MTPPIAKPSRIDVQGLSVHLPDPGGRRVPVLGPLDLQVAAGEFIAVVGPSGCGKTTLLRALHGLLPPTGGRVLIDGVPVTGPDPQRALVFQHDGLMPWRSAAGNAGFGPEIQGAEPAAAENLARRVLRRVGLERFADFRPGQMSGGMRSRANVARALTIDPSTLLLDEPFAALDAISREALQDELLRLTQGRVRTVVLVTHLVEEAVYLADRVVVLSHQPGRVVGEVAVAHGRSQRDDFRGQPGFLAATRAVRGLLVRAAAR